MRTALIFPPQWNPFQPYLSLPSLLAFLKQHGESASLYDANIEFYHYLFSKNFQNRALDRASSLFEIEMDENKASNLLAATAIINDAHDYYAMANNLRRGEAYGDLPSLRMALSSWESYLSAVSTIYSPITISCHGLRIPGLGMDLDRVRDFCENIDSNPFLAYYQDELVSKIVKDNPNIIGISIIGIEQIYPGLTLCKLLKKAIPTAHITIGGSVFSRFLETPNTYNFLFGEFFDSIVMYEGEVPLLNLIRAISEGSDLHEVPNLVYISSDSLVQKTAVGGGVDVNELPPPDFTELDLTKYYSPVPVLPILTSRGCYWGKCAFCHHGMIYGKGYRLRRTELLANDLKFLSLEHNTPFFTFNDEAVPPRHFSRLAEYVEPHEYAISGLIKFEKSYDDELIQKMDHIGLRGVYVGLESASERVLAHMKKNTLKTTMNKFLTHTDAYNIWNHMFFFFGFPTETAEEAQETIDFVLNTKTIHSFGAATFSLEHNSPIHHNPMEYGVTRIGESQDKFFDLYYDYDVEYGLNAIEAQEWLQKFLNEENKNPRPGMQIVDWLPRELLVIMLGLHGKDALLEMSIELSSWLNSNLEKELIARRFRALEIPKKCLTASRIKNDLKSGYMILDYKTGDYYPVNDNAYTFVKNYGDTFTVGQLLTEIPEFRKLA